MPLYPEAIMPAVSLFQPLPGLAIYMLPFWPLIFWRIQRLKAWFRAHGGPGSQMLWGVTKHGRVVVIRLSDDFHEQRRPPIAPVSKKLADALSGVAYAPCMEPFAEVFEMVSAEAIALAHMTSAPMALLPLPET